MWEMRQADPCPVWWSRSFGAAYAGTTWLWSRCLANCILRNLWWMPQNRLLIGKIILRRREKYGYKETKISCWFYLYGFCDCRFLFSSFHRKRDSSRLHRRGLPCLRLHSSGRTNTKTDRRRLVWNSRGICASISTVCGISLSPSVCTCRFPYQPESKNEQLNRILWYKGILCPFFNREGYPLYFCAHF